MTDPSLQGMCTARRASYSRRLNGSVRALARFVRTQTKNARRLLAGERLTYPSLGSMTLDKDDVLLARRWLAHHEEWKNASIVSEYEKEFAQWNGSRHAFAFMGGRVALSACIHALGLKAGDEVILPGYTCVVVPNAFQFAGVKPIYCDIELDTYGLDASLIQRHINSNTKAIMIQHLYGLVCRDYERLIEIAARHGLFVIEDCAHSTGAEYKDRKVGNYGHVAFYSSEQSKVFTTIQGGMAVTNDETLGKRLRAYYSQAPLPDEEWIAKQLRNVIYNYYSFKHPQRWFTGELVKEMYAKYRLISTTQEEECGIQPRHYGRRMPAPIAAIGSNQLKKIDRYNAIRRGNALKWDSWCARNGYKKPSVIGNSIPLYLRYPVMVGAEKKRDTSWALRELGVKPGVWFKGNIHPTGQQISGCPNADRAVRECINLPTLLE